jgi:hypothetical protein
MTRVRTRKWNQRLRSGLSASCLRIISAFSVCCTTGEEEVGQHEVEFACAWCVSCLLDELQALEGHLPATHVQTGQDLVVGRRRRVSEERLRERTLDRSLEVLCVG